MSPPNKRRYSKYTLEGVFIETFDGMHAAAASVGIHSMGIIRCCRGRRRTAGGFIWKYEDHEIIQNEIWKIHYSGIIISNMGRVRFRNGRIGLGSMDSQGYYQASDVNRKHYRISRLVLQTFQPTDDASLTVDHIDRDKGNNRLDNLRWATKREQTLNRAKPRDFSFHCRTCTCKPTL